RCSYEWLASPAAPVVLPDVLIREIGAERRGELHRRADRELVALPLRQQRRYRLGGSRTIVVQVAAAERPFRVLGPFRAEPEPARVVVILEQLAVQQAGEILRKRDVKLVELTPPGQLIVAQQRPSVRELVRQTQRELRRILDRRRH